MAATGSEGAAPIPRASLRRAGLRAFAAFRRHEMTDVAASLTYYAMMSLFPMVVVATSLFALIGDRAAVSNAVDYFARRGADPTTQAAIRNVMDKIVGASGGAVSVALVVSTALALNGASGAFGAAGRALNRVYAVDDDRGFVRRKATDLGMTLVVVLLLIVVIVALFLGGGIADDLLGDVGLGATGATVWSIVRWPVAVAAAMVTYSVIYAYAPDVRPRRWRWISPGAVAGVLIWIVLSIAFGLYLQHFSTYGAAYGTAGAAIALLLWLWLSSCAFLLGAELNAEIEHAESAGRAGPPFPTPPPSPADPSPPAAGPRSARETGTSTRRVR